MPNYADSVDKQKLSSLEILDQNRRLADHEVQFDNRIYSVLNGVFSPAIFNAWKSFTPILENDIKPKTTLLEIGCGCGISGIHLYLNRKLSELVMTDINPKAVINAKLNALKLTDNSKITVLESDIFDNLNTAQKFDTIYWNYPWIQEVDDYEYKDDLEKGLFDPGYKYLKRFLFESKEHLGVNGVLYLGWGDFGNQKLLEDLLEEYKYSHSIVSNDEGLEENIVRFILYKIVPKVSHIGK